MSSELITFLVMLIVFLLGCFLLKLPVSISMVASAVLGALVGGAGFALRDFVEGMFSYVDTILVITTAMIFMKVVEESGALDAVASLIIEKFHKIPALMLCLIMIIIMFPGMITGSSSAAVLSAGAIMAPVLMMLGIPKIETASILAMGGILGAIAPPINIPVMIIGGGVDIPYSGFELPLALLTFPLAFLFVIMLGYKFVKNKDYGEVEASLNKESREKYGFRIYLPLIVVIALMIMNRVITVIPDIGMPLVFLIGTAVGCFTGNRFNVAKSSKEAVKNALPVMGILMGVGMMIQVMTLTGVRGLIVAFCMSLPEIGRYLVMAISMPLFGAISSFGSASVLGVPFLLSFLAKDEIIVASAISLISVLGDMMPPTALAGIFAAQVVGMEKYTPVLKKCLVPCLIVIAWAILFIVFSEQLAVFIV